MCMPRFDSCRAAAAGHGTTPPGPPTGEVRSVTRSTATAASCGDGVQTVDGVVRLIDTMPPEQDHWDADTRVARWKVPQVEMTFRWVLRFAYGDRCRGCGAASDGREAPRRRAVRRRYGDRLPYRVPVAPHGLCSRPAGERLSWVMSSPTAGRAARAGRPDRRVARSERSGWTGPRASPAGRTRTPPLADHAEGPAYAPTGGIVAAPTTSLPETLGGGRNWDYRYCWLRDATFTLLALDNFGCTDEALAWRKWLLRAVAGDPADLQIMYGLGGERHLVEWEVDWLSGYQGARPVRIGNAAYRQLQLDVYGEVMDALHLARERGLGETPDSWAMQRGMMRHLETVWQMPDKGLWEVRGPDRHFTHSRVMLWVAFDRAVRAVEEFGLPGPVDRWRELRDEVRDEVLAKGWNASLDSFTQYYGGTELDAATLLIPAVGFLPGDDPRVLGTLEAVARVLKRGDLVDRYETGPGESEVDGLAGVEGSFLACSFWYVDALALAGRREEAQAMFDRLVGLANDVGLLAEEYDSSSGRMTGNFPQAFSHLALVNSAAVLFGGHTREERDRGGVA
ncbi:glycoside hydrolase family 15 protein [Saccharothrix sp. MB29]|nr:glycoside hydrolase family 15 protein [Saccharothrix sp. MB29]